MNTVFSSSDSAVAEPFVGRGEQVDMLDVALDYHERFNGAITLCPRWKGKDKSKGKVPECEEWQNQSYTPEEIERFAQREHGAFNVGVRFGPMSGIIDIEYDSAEQKSLLAELLGPDAPVGPCFGSGREIGGHHLFLYDPALAAIGKNTHDYKGKLGCRIGANDGGSHSVFPPSVHYSGKQYTWRVGLEDADIPPLPRGAIQRLLDDARSKEKPAGDSTGQQSDTGADPVSVAEAIASMRRVRVGEENDGSRRLLAYACRAVEYGLSDKQALAAVRLVACDHPFPKFFADGDIIQRLRDAESRVERGTATGTSTKSIEYQRLTSSELAGGDFALEYLTEGILVRAQPDILGGSKKTLKTSVGMDLGVSLATAGHFLGYFPCPRAVRVAFMSGESGLATLQDTARRVCSAARLELPDINNMIWSPDLPRLGDPSHMEAVRQFLAGDEIEVLFVDPAYLTMPGADAGNLLIQGELLRSVTETCRDVGTTLILIHHTKRGRTTEQFTPFDLDDLAWAGFAEFARQWMLLSRRSLYVPGTGHHELWLSVGGSAGHGGLWGLDIDEGRFEGFGSRHWSVRVLKSDEIEEQAQQQRDTARDAKAQRQVERDAAHILRTVVCMERQQGTARDIKDRAKRGGQATAAAIAWLVDQGSLEEVEITKGKRTYPGFRVVAGGGE